MTIEERALAFRCEGAWLYGIASLPAHPASRGVLIVVGGLQYRAGSHRQFTLLARSLAAQGVPALRFDYRGMGDSEGPARDFDGIGEDLRCAIDAFFQSAPGLREVAIWGLCDAACAASFYAHQDRRVSGLVLLNPWVRTGQGVAKAYLKHYYLRRLFEREFWSKVRRGRFDYAAAAHSFRQQVKRALLRADSGEAPTGAGKPLPCRMLDGLNHFPGRILFILAGNDLTAQEFSDLAAGDRRWRALLASTRVARRDLPHANHTFSRREWRDQVAAWTAGWIKAY